MSEEVEVKLEVRSMDIMKNTLNTMNIAFTEDNESKIRIAESYHDIVINSDSGQITYDEMNKSKVDQICQKYMINWYKDRAIREGNDIKEEVMANGEVHLHVLN